MYLISKEDRVHLPSQSVVRADGQGSGHGHKAELFSLKPSMADLIAFGGLAEDVVAGVRSTL
jgi:hypothetical protein